MIEHLRLYSFARVQTTILFNFITSIMIIASTAIVVGNMRLLKLPEVSQRLGAP